MAARWAIFRRSSIPSLGRPIFKPLAFARAMPAFVRSPIFWASTLAKDESSASRMLRRCRRALCWNSIWRNLQRHEVIGSGGEVNWVIDSRCGKGLPAVDLAHVDLAGGEQGPEQHASSLC